jgi:hypothetical protein
LSLAVEQLSKELMDDMVERLQKATLLVRDGKVYRRGRGYMVQSQTSKRVYRVMSGGCQCEDSWYRAPRLNGLPACKHQLAVWLFERTEELVREVRSDTSS